MIIIFNILLIGMAALIAYWWATQGLLSAVLHLVCVIAAGTLAFAFWEPIANAMMSGGTFDNYAWGVSLIGTFAISLLILRIISDKIAFGNTQFPDIVNLGAGGVAGMCSGVLTVGICVISMGFIQSTSEIMGYQGYGRDSSNNAIVTNVGGQLIVPFTKLTNDFFGMLSVGAFRPDISDTPLRQYNPKIDELSCLVRDSIDNGKGQLALLPNAASVTKVRMSESGLIVMQVHFKAEALDFGGQLSLSSSQVRLISKANGQKTPEVIYPVRWEQETQNDGENVYNFDAVSHYASSVPARKTADITFVFEANDTFIPRFLQIRGTRLDVPTVDSAALAAVDVERYTGKVVSPEDIRGGRPVMGYPLDNIVLITERLGRLTLSTNGLPSSITVENQYFVEGKLIRKWTNLGVSGKLRVKGVKNDEGAKVVQIDVSRDSAASIFDLLPVVGENAEIALIDNDRNKYWPIGYYLDAGGKMDLTLTPGSPIRTIGELPPLPTSGAIKMTLIFQVTEGQTIREFMLGDITVGTCDKYIKRPVDDI
ncbi:MAG: CvpA family protein [Planctomycetes bacterium]|nr:CvpA family protein [Planctomycetota bacterium]